jgi:choline dehydrogenase-like flavoprotein
MLVDARSLPAGTTIETDICIIGAGAAGITIAREFASANLSLSLIESGGLEYNADTQLLYEAENVGQHFPNVTTSRLRFFGGTTNHWGGYCLPFDEIDFESRDEFPFHGWPFTRAHLDPWYARAQDVCQLGTYDYNPKRWDTASVKVPPPFEGPVFQRKILQENPLRFGPIYEAELRRAPRTTVYLNANAFDLDGGDEGTEVRQLSVKTLTGSLFTVRARVYVLATGGLENARLLLASGTADGVGLGNAHDLVGRFFMTHIVYTAGTIVPTDSRANFDFETNDTYVAGKYRIDRLLGLSADSMRSRRLPNAIMGWTYKLSAVAGALDALKRLGAGERGPGGSTIEDLSLVLRNWEGVADYAARKVLFHQSVPVDAINVWGSSEQQPNPDSRVLLGARRDRLGMRELEIDWQLTDIDRENAATINRLFGAELGRVGFGRLRSSFGDDGAWPKDFYGNEHHMGTTRMHVDPKSGVVDENCRVHGMANLYVAGSSVFPTGGANNPTLTIVALALRLADHLKGTFK